MTHRTRRFARLLVTLVAASVLTPLTALPVGAQTGGVQTGGVQTGAAQAGAATQARRVMPPAPIVPAPPSTLEIATDGAVPVVSRDDYVTGTMTLAGQAHRIEIKGRGNSTWGWPKKPYKIKLAEDASLLGMPATEEWVLLANYADRAALRTHMAFALASRTGLAWTPRSRFVEVTVNGQLLGLYTLTEQVEQGPTRVSLPEDGYLLEIDEKFRRGGDPGFRTRRRTPVAFKDPDELTRPQRRMIRRAVNEFEDVLYGEDFADPETGYAAFADLDTFVDWYLVQELFRNQDSFFYSSVHVTWKPGGPFAMGPVWDFDLSAGTRWQAEAGATDWYTRVGSHWLSRMLEDPAFVARVQTRWAELQPAVTEVVSQIPAAAAVVREAALRDWDLWHRSGGPVPGSVHGSSYDAEVDFMYDYLVKRRDWLNRDQVYFDTTHRTVKESRPVTKIPVRLWGDRSRPVRVRYAWETNGDATAEDLERATGELVFWPGQQVKRIPLQLRNDRLAESDESFALVLSDVAGGAILGTPARLPITIAASDQQPDLTIGKGRRSGVGKDVYANRPAKQRVRARVARGAKKVFTARVGNDGTVRTRIQVRARGARKGLTVRFYSRGKDVTRAVRSTRGWRPLVKPGGRRGVRIVVRARPGTRPGAVRMLKLRAEWRGDGRHRDAVGARLRVTR